MTAGVKTGCDLPSQQRAEMDRNRLEEPEIMSDGCDCHTTNDDPIDFVLEKPEFMNKGCDVENAT